MKGGRCTLQRTTCKAAFGTFASTLFRHVGDSFEIMCCLLPGVAQFRPNLTVEGVPHVRYSCLVASASGGVPRAKTGHQNIYTDNIFIYIYIKQLVPRVAVHVVQPKPTLP